MTYESGTELVTLTWVEADWWASGCETVTMPVSNLYPRGGEPSWSRTWRRAYRWAVEYNGMPSPARINVHTQD